MRRGLTYLAVALAAAAAFVMLAHLPAARSIALRWGLQSLRDRAGIDATASDISYNLLTLDVHLRGLTATAVGSTIPFLTADEVAIDLPWAAAFGTMAVERLDARGLAIDIVRAADGTLNLPKSDTARTTNPPRVVVGSLALAGGRVRYRDIASQFSLDVTGMNLTMTPSGSGPLPPGSGVIGGRVSTQNGPALRAPNLSLDGTVTGSLAYDGSSLTLSGVSYRSTVGELRTSGRLDALWGTTTAQLTLDGAVKMADLSTALGIDPAMEGQVTLHGPITGELAKLSAALTASSDRVQWRHLAPQTLSAGVVLTPDDVRVDRASLQLGGGRLSGTGSLAFDSGTASVDASWQGVPIDALVEGPLPGNPDALLTGRTSLTWDMARGIQGLTGRIDTRADAPAGRRARHAVRPWWARRN